MLDAVSSYKNTSVHWTKSQGKIIELLEEKEVKDIRFSNISREIVEQSGLVMEENTYALMIEFYRITT